jgi:hypothetical protein
MLKISIPFVDLRGKTPVDLLRSYPDRALALVKAARRSYGKVSRAACMFGLPVADRQSHQWLKRTKNPYLYEIESFADIVRSRGMYTLNLHYEWACTTGVYRASDGVSMMRVLDCPIPSLGKHAMVVLQKGRAGEYYNITWPGLSGVFNAMAPGRFAAAINKAPMRRHKLGYIGDWAVNRLRMNKQTSLPPSHLLRQAMDYAPHYEAAKHMLCNVPVAVPVIFVLSGTKPGEGCVIERLENAFEITELGAGQRVCASNHFNGGFAAQGNGWRPREPDSHGRLQHASTLHGYELEQEHFDWVQAPIINPHTRLCIITDAAAHRLIVQGYEGMTKATELFSTLTEAYDERKAV